jgi:hypothetical protein
VTDGTHEPIAGAAAAAAQREGVARLGYEREAIEKAAAATIANARETTELLMRHGLIAEPPGTS